MMERLLDANPTAVTRKRGGASRERVLADGELALIWQCRGDGHDHNRLVRLLLLTGQTGGIRTCCLDRTQRRYAGHTGQLDKERLGT